jgi:hypothetical protein
MPLENRIGGGGAFAFLFRDRKGRIECWLHEKVDKQCSPSMCSLFHDQLLARVSSAARHSGRDMLEGGGGPCCHGVWESPGITGSLILASLAGCML